MNHDETSYGFLFVGTIDDSEAVDLYLPLPFLTQLQLRPGSEVLERGMTSPQAEIIHIKPSKGAEDPRMGKHPFIASVRFPNRPTVLSSFLDRAHQRNIKFASIRTHGAKGTDLADVIFEGALPEAQVTFETGMAIALELGQAARDVDGRTNYAYAIRYGEEDKGEISTSLYRVNLPILRGDYGRARFGSTPAPAALGDYVGVPKLVRLTLDAGRNLIAVDLTIASQFAYLVDFRAAGLKPGAQVTQTILQVLVAHNIDALNAFEYPQFDPGGSQSGTVHEAIKRIGAIELLFTTKEPLPDLKKLESYLKRAIRERRWTSGFNLTVRSLDNEMQSWKHGEVPEDATWSPPRKVLDFGRYLFVSKLGEGASAVVNAYLDQDTGDLVAGKHVLSHEPIKQRELQALIRISRSGGSPHLVQILNYFIDGEIPVLILEAMDGTLAENAWNTDSRDLGIRHRVPWNLSQFLRMAAQLLRGLEWLHSRTGVKSRLLHADLKPANIGFSREGQKITWKLLDFGLAKVLKGTEGAEPTVHLSGTAPYMAPEVLNQERSEADDIFALGIVLFRVLNGWRFPGKRTTGGILKGVLEEVVEYLQYLNGGVTEEPAGFKPSEWRLGEPFRRHPPPKTLEDDVRTLIYKMLDLSADRRPRDAGKLADSFEALAAVCNDRPPGESGEIGDGRTEVFDRELTTGRASDEEPQ